MRGHSNGIREQSRGQHRKESKRVESSSDFTEDFYGAESVPKIVIYLCGGNFS